MSRFDGRVVLITGSSEGIGKHLAACFAEAGAHVVVNGRSRKGQEVADALQRQGLSATFMSCDVARPQACKTLIDSIVERFGRLDVLINNAGNKPERLQRDIESLTDGDFTEAVDPHLRGPYNLSTAAWPHMRGQRYGRIINVSSGHIFGSVQDHGMVPFAIAKAGVIGLTKGLALQGRRDGILVNAVFPAALDSNWNRVEWAELSEERERSLADICSKVHLWPFVRWLSSEDASCYGEMFSLCNENVTRVFIGDTDNTNLAAQAANAEVALCVERVLQGSGYYVPKSIGHFFGAHLGKERRKALASFLASI